MQHSAHLCGSQCGRKLALDFRDHLSKRDDPDGVSLEGFLKRLVLLLCGPVAHQSCNGSDVGEFSCARCIPHGVDQSFGPLGRRKFAKCLPCFPPAPDLVAFNGTGFSGGVEAALPTLATDGDHLVVASQGWMKTQNINITVVGVLVENEVRMIFSRQELDIVLNEVAFVHKLLFDNLFEYVFFRRHVSW